MKNIVNLFVLLGFIGGMLVSCETYGDPEVEISGVAPLDGRWVCYAFDYDDYIVHPTTAARLELVEIYTSGTSEKEPGKLWMNIGYMLRNNAVSIETVSVKVDCSPQAGAFGIAGGKTALAPDYFATNYYRTTEPAMYNGTYSYLHYYSGYAVSCATISTAGQNITISDGKVTVNGYNTPTGYKADLIVFALEIGNDRYMIEGHRHTGWAEDYDSTHDTAAAHHKWNVAAYIEEWIYRRDGAWPIPRYFEPRNTFHNYVTL